MILHCPYHVNHHQLHSLEYTCYPVQEGQDLQSGISNGMFIFSDWANIMHV